jgi:hypothetical protein
MLSTSTVNYLMAPTGLVVHLHAQMNQASILGTLSCIGPITFSIKEFATQICLGLLLFGGSKNVTDLYICNFSKHIVNIECKRY